MSLTSKGEHKAFPPPSHPQNVVPLFKLPTENNKHSNFEWRGGGRGEGGGGRGVDSFAL